MFWLFSIKPFSSKYMVFIAGLEKECERIINHNELSNYYCKIIGTGKEEKERKDGKHNDPIKLSPHKKGKITKEMQKRRKKEEKNQHNRWNYSSLR